MKLGKVFLFLSVFYLFGCASTKEIEKEVYYSKQRIYDSEKNIDTLKAEVLSINKSLGHISALLQRVQSKLDFIESKANENRNNIELNRKVLDKGVDRYYGRVREIRFNVKRLCKNSPGICK